MFVLVSVSLGQTNNYPLFAPSPSSGATPITPGIVVVNGTSGGPTYYYWVVARYPVGNSLITQSPGVAFNVNNTLSVTNYVTVLWSPVGGATGYDILRTTTQMFPGNGQCLNCLVASNTTAFTVNDTSNTQSSYILQNVASSATANISLNNRDYAVPSILFDAPQHTKFILTGNIGEDFRTSRYTIPFQTGTLAQRPICTAAGQVYFATDTLITYQCTNVGSNTWVIIGSGGTGTCDAVTNLLKGNGLGGCIDSGIVPSTVVIGAASSVLGQAVTFADTTGKLLSNGSNFIEIGDALYNITPTSNVTIKGGLDTTSNAALGSVIVKGTTLIAGSGEAGGANLFGGDNNSANAASQAGNAEVRPGYSFNGGLPGLLNIHEVYFAGASTQWNLQCPSGVSFTVNDCGAFPQNWLGVADIVGAFGISVSIHVIPSETPVNASAAVIVGHTVCAGATAGKVTDSGGTIGCTNAQGTTVGIVLAIAGTWVTENGTVVLSNTLPIISMNSATTITSTTPATIIGTSTITGGTTTRILYDNGGVYGEYSSVPQSLISPAASVFNSGTITIPSGNSILVGCTSTCAVPVPVPAAGYEICIKNDAGISTVITLNALGGGAMYPKADDSGYGTAGTGTMVSSAATGNKVCLIGRDSTHYELGAVNNSINWTVN